MAAMKTPFPLCAALLVLAGATFAQDAATTNSPAHPRPIYVVAGVDRDVILGGKTYLTGYAGYADPSARRGAGGAHPLPADVHVSWSKESGPGSVTFASDSKTETTATFSEVGTYVLKLAAISESGSPSSTLTVKVAEPPPRTASTWFIPRITRSTIRSGTTAPSR
jgi:hypothetical protein